MDAQTQPTVLGSSTGFRGRCGLKRALVDGERGPDGLTVAPAPMGRCGLKRGGESAVYVRVVAPTLRVRCLLKPCIPNMR